MPVLNRRTTPAGVLALCGCVVGLWGCASLAEIQPDTCGNGVVEAAIDEECDGQEHCGAPGTPAACHYECDPGGMIPVACPAGFGCGVDRICRQPTGTFEALSAITTVTALDLFTGDINDDGCHEVVHTTRLGTTVTAPGSHAPGLCPVSRQELPSGSGPPGALTSPAPMLADLTGEGRPDLLRPAEALFGTGLFVHVAAREPTVESMLYSTVRAKESRVRPLRVTHLGADALVLLIEGAGGMPGTGLAGVVNPINRPQNLGMGLPGGLDELVVLQAAELGATSGCAACDEVVVGVAGEPRLKLYGVGSKTVMVMGKPEQQMTLAELQPALELDGGATLRSRNAGLALVDYDLDGVLDVIVNASDQKLHVAYGVGDGRFHSQSPVDALAPDGHTSVLAVADAMVASADFRFVVGDFDTSSAQPEVVGIPCPPSEVLASPACGAIAGGCEAVVVDIDFDGRPDIVSSDEQQPGLTVRRSAGDGSFHVSYADTQCPPHDLTSGDFDDDGIADVAFFDQATEGQSSGETEAPFTVLKVAHGKAFAAPGAPASSGRFELAGGLAAGRFVPGAMTEQLYAARSFAGTGQRSGLALIESHGDQQLFAPFYFPTDPADNGGDANLLRLELPGAATGRFGETEENEPIYGVAVLTRDRETSTPGRMRLWHLEGQASASTLDATRQTSETSGLECDACVLVPIDVVPAGTQRDGIDELLLLGDGEAIVFEVEAAGGAFVERARFATAHSFRWVDGATQPPKYALRPLVADLDGDGILDVVARATDGTLVAFWGQADGTLDERELLAAPDCGAATSCGGWAVAVLDVDGDGVGELLVVGPGTFAFHEIAGRELVPMTGMVDAGALGVIPAASTDFTAVSAADLDGDGVSDLVVMPSSSLILTLRGVPVHP